MSKTIRAVPDAEINKTVDEYWRPECGWDWNLLQQYLPMTTLDELRAALIDEEAESEDQICWREESSGSFSVRSAYSIMRHDTNAPEAAKWNAIWRLKITNRIKVFLWLTRHKKLMTNSMRMRRGMTTSDGCWLCHNAREDIDHVLRRCTAADEVWRMMLPKWHSETRNLSFQDWLDRGLTTKGNGFSPQNDNTLFAVSLWWIWRWRNEAVFSNSFHTLQSKRDWISLQVE